MAAEATQEATQRLAKFAATLRYDDLPEPVREHCKTLFLDALACAVAGRQGEETGQMAALAAALAQGRESSVIGGGHLSLAGATLLNGYLVTAVTMCDVHRTTMTHITPEIVPPALAIAERDGLSGRDLLVAIAAGCEVTTRIGLGLDYPAFRARGWHGPGILGPFGAAAAVGSLLEFDADTMARALRPRRQPGRRHLCRLGHADGEIPSMPRRAVGLDGGVVGAAGFRRHARIPHRQGRRPLQRLCQMAASPTRRSPISAHALSSSRSQCGYGRRRRSFRA